MRGGSTAVGKVSRAIAIRFAAVELPGLLGHLIAGSMSASQFGPHTEKADRHRDERHHARRRYP
jgi:hypothetical protein